MGREKFSNSLTTALNGTINNSVTTVVVDDASSFPLTYFRLLIDSEIMLCTSRSGNTLTVLRGQEGTAAASHFNLAVVNHLLTAGSLDAYRLDLLAAAGLIPRAASLSVDDDEFDDENFTGWTIIQNTPTCSVIEKQHRLSINIPASPGATWFAFMKAKTPSAGDWVQAAFQQAGRGGGYPYFGMMMADGVTMGSGKQIHYGPSVQDNRFWMRPIAGYGSGTAEVADSPTQRTIWATLHLRLTWLSPDTYAAAMSPDGISWAHQYTSQTIGSMGVAPSYMGFAFWCNGNDQNYNYSVPYCHFSF